MSSGPKLCLGVALSLLVAVAYACGGSGDDSSPAVVTSPAPTPTPVNPKTLLEGSGRVMEGLGSFHFRLVHRSGSTPLPGFLGLALDEVEGDVVKPDKLSVRFGGAIGISYLESRLVTVGETSYMLNPLNARWEQVPPDVSPLGFFDPSRGISSMLERLASVSLLSGSAEVYRLEGSLPAEALRPLLGDTMEGTTVSVELAIDSSELFVTEAVFKGRVTSAEPDGTVRVITLSHFNEPLSIELPR